MPPFLSRWAGAASGLTLVLALAGCSALPSPPPAVTRYDLGLPPALQAQDAQAVPVVMADIQAPLEDAGQTAFRYRLAYADPYVLNAYAHARWSMPPSQLVQQRLREHLSRNGRVVLQAQSGDWVPRVNGQGVLVLRMTLEEFSQVFSNPEHSEGRVRIRATLVKPQPQGDVLLAQRVFDASTAASASNAAAGAQALAVAVDAIGAELNQWIKAAPMSTPAGASAP